MSSPKTTSDVLVNSDFVFGGNPGWKVIPVASLGVAMQERDIALQDVKNALANPDLCRDEGKRVRIVKVIGDTTITLVGKRQVEQKKLYLINAIKEKSGKEDEK